MASSGADGASRLRVLYLAFYFPPTTGGGVERTLRFARYLPELGIDVEVLTPDDAKWLAADPSSLARVPPGTRVHRARYRGPGNRVLPGDRLAAADGMLARLALRARLAPRRLLVPDVDVPWLLDAVPAALRLLRSGRFDAIVTTSPPHSVTLAGALLARRSGLPWIADWRDPWLAHPDLDLRRAGVRAKQAVAARLAHAAARQMSAAACVDGGIAREVAELAPHVPRAVIPNGAEVDEIAALARRPAPVLTFLHAGYFFGDRSAGAFLTGLAGLLAQRPALRGQLRARFVGGLPESDRELVARLGLAETVRLEPTLPHGEVLQAQRDADVLLLFMQDKGERSQPFVPQKTWEYLAAERPVLALAPPAGAAAAELADQAEVAAPNDPVGVQAALGRLADRYAAGTLTVAPLTPARRTEISRRGRAEAFAALVRAAVGRSAAAPR